MPAQFHIIKSRSNSEAQEVAFFAQLTIKKKFIKNDIFIRANYDFIKRFSAYFCEHAGTMNVIINVWGAYWRTYAHSHRQARTQKESASMKKVTSVFGVYNSIANNLSLVSLAVPSVKEEKIQNDSIEYDKRTNVSILQHARKMANLLLAHPKGLGEGVRSVENLFFESNSSFRNMKREKRNSVTAARVEKWNSLGELKQPLLFFFRISLKLKIFYLSKKKESQIRTVSLTRGVQREPQEGGEKE